ncbi:TetR/AcrR family transcriptional regulator [Streptomyces sp. NPDC091972]|uniref:TetR/AcrR family transcriptional regulator n=1 Tax=Streptomyces sp. NPDC091972 TaxID=3366007 RepID=UPI0037F34065
MTAGTTRDRITQTALKLFTAKGYDKTSLREIAEHLGVTKAAVYYHFKTKEDILTALFAERIRPVEALIAWMQGQAPGPSTRQEALRRYAAEVAHVTPLFGIFQDNGGALRNLAIAATYRDVMKGLMDLFLDPEADLASQLRCVLALLVVHGAPQALAGIGNSTKEERAAALAVALELLVSADSARFLLGDAHASEAQLPL